MNDRNEQNNDPDSPERLRAALSRLNSRRIGIPPKVDDAILCAAREHLESVASNTLGQIVESGFGVPLSGGSGGPRKRGTPNWEELCAGVMEFFGGRRWATLGAAAVAIVAAGALVWLGGHSPLQARNEDLNSDGVVDMLDAFALARELQQGQSPRPQLDFNGDGAVDERDVQILANRAVSLESRGRS